MIKRSNKNKQSKEEVIKEEKEIKEEIIPKETETPEGDNQESCETIDNPDDTIIGTPSGEDLEYTLKLISSKFGLGDKFTVTKFDNGANKAKITVDSRDFEVTVTVKDKSMYQFPSVLKAMGEEV